MSRIERDQQRSRLYAAEKAISKGDAFTSLAETRAYVQRIVRSRWWQRHYGDAGAPDIEVRDGRGRSKPASLTGAWAITLPRAARYERIVLHELAHQACDAAYGPNKAAHGRHYASTFAALVGRWLGAEAKRALLDAYRQHGVRWRLP